MYHFINLQMQFQEERYPIFNFEIYRTIFLAHCFIINQRIVKKIKLELPIFKIHFKNKSLPNEEFLFRCILTTQFNY